MFWVNLNFFLVISLTEYMQRQFTLEYQLVMIKGSMLLNIWTKIIINLGSARSTGTWFIFYRSHSCFHLQLNSIFSSSISIQQYIFEHTASALSLMVFYLKSSRVFFSYAFKVSLFPFSSNEGCTLLLSKCKKNLFFF